MRYQAAKIKGKSKHGGGACRRRRKLRRSTAANNTTEAVVVGEERPPPLVAAYSAEDADSEDALPSLVADSDSEDEDEAQEAADDPTAPRIVAAAQALNPTRISEESKAFLALGWTNWHMGFIGANKSAEHTRELLRVVVKLLMRIQKVAIDMDVVQLPPQQSVLDFFTTLVTERVVHAALHTVMQDYTLSLSSLGCHLYDLIEGLRWLRVQGGSRCKDEDFAALDSLIRDSAKGVKRSVRKKKRLSDRSIATAVFNREYPARGLQELREYFEEDANRIGELFGSGTKPTITDALYRHVLEVLYVGFWVTAPQGRIQGIETLQLKHVEEFEKKGYALNNNFKTSDTFDYQPVMLSSLTRSLLNIYLKVLRPSVSPTNAQPRPDDAMFLNFNGTAFTNISRLVASYFRVKAGLKITTTTLRAIVETECANRRARGEITDAERTSISVIVGHGNKTAKDDYVRTDLDADVKRARLAFGVDVEVVAAVEESLPSLLPKVDKWGTEHPDRENTGRARWTTDEKEYLQSLAESLLAENSELYKDRLMSECLKRIKADRDTRRFFHARHIHDCGRLRAGYRLLVGR
jgi:hypothetical protein